MRFCIADKSQELKQKQHGFRKMKIKQLID
jgi:hypothetical protein